MVGTNQVVVVKQKFIEKNVGLKLCISVVIIHSIPMQVSLYYPW